MALVTGWCASPRPPPHEVREAAAGRQVSPRGLLRIADEPAHPVEEHILHAPRARRGEEHTRVAIGDGREEVPEGGGVEPTSGDIAEVSPRGGIEARPIDVAPEGIQQMRE